MEVCEEAEFDPDYVDPALELEGKQEELKNLKDLECYLPVLRRDVPTGKKSQTGRWVVNVKSATKVRCRWAIRDFANSKRYDVFAATASASIGRVMEYLALR